MDPKAARRRAAALSSAQSTALAISPIAERDYPEVGRIYAAGIAAGNATFERDVPSWEQWRQARGGLPSLVARNDAGEVLGWAALTPASSRCVYSGVAAISIYVDPDHRREGVARQLLIALIAAAEEAALWTLEAGIFPENLASVALHEGCGFRLVGVRRRVGQMADGSWRDVLLYERRSEVVGA
ncbi:MAG: GNAT family N-acetyltransferase [Solirubrobacteraceae bacterium]